MGMPRDPFYRFLRDVSEPFEAAPGHCLPKIICTVIWMF